MPWNFFGTIGVGCWVRGFGIAVLLLFAGAADASAHVVSHAPYLQFSPANGARVGPAGRIFVFTNEDINGLFVRVARNGDEIDNDVRLVQTAPSFVYAVSVFDDDDKPFTVELWRVDHHGHWLLGAADYDLDPSISAPLGARVQGLGNLTGVTRSRFGDWPYPGVVSLWVFDKAPAYRLEWAKSREAFDEGELWRRIVPRNPALVGNRITLDDSVFELGDERETGTIFARVVPLDGDRYDWREHAEAAEVDLRQIAVRTDPHRERTYEAEPTERFPDRVVAKPNLPPKWIELSLSDPSRSPRPSQLESPSSPWASIWILAALGVVRHTWGTRPR